MQRLTIVLLTAILCACGGAGGVTAIAPHVSPGGIQLGNAATTTAIPAAGGITGTITFPALSAAATVQLSSSTSAPPGAAGLDETRRHPQNLGTLAVYEYVTMVATTTITLPNLPEFTLTFPATIPTAGKSFFYGISAPHGAAATPAHFDAHGPASISGQTVRFPAIDGSFTLTAGEAYTFLVYATYAAAAGPLTPRIYVADSSYGAGDNVYIFNADGTPGTPAHLSSSTSPTSSLTAIAIDSAGKIYLTHTDYGMRTDTLTTFNSDGSPAKPTITGLSAPSAVTVDTAGKIYVVNAGRFGEPPGSDVTTYNRDGIRTTPTITRDLHSPHGIAVNGSGEIYVLNESFDFQPAKITTYMPDGSPTAPIALPLNQYAAAIAADAAGKIYVAGFSGGPLVSTYTPQGTASVPTIAGSGATGLAVDAAGKIYVGNYVSTGQIQTYSPNGSPTVPTINLPPQIYPDRIAVH